MSLHFRHAHRKALHIEFFNRIDPKRSLELELPSAAGTSCLDLPEATT